MLAPWTKTLDKLIEKKQRLDKLTTPQHRKLQREIDELANTLVRQLDEQATTSLRVETRGWLSIVGQC